MPRYRQVHCTVKQALNIKALGKTAIAMQGAAVRRISVDVEKTTYIVHRTASTIPAGAERYRSNSLTTAIVIFGTLFCIGWLFAGELMK